VILVDGTEHRGAESSRGRICANLPHVEREDHSAGYFNPVDDLLLHSQGADQAIEEGDDNNTRLTCLNHFHCALETRPLVERSATGDVQFLEHVDELETVALTSAADTLSLL
jgi:hypothetical protein